MYHTHQQIGGAADTHLNTNSSQYGDLVGDTPPDHRYFPDNHLYNNSCQLTSHIYKSRYYSPYLNNLMSYYSGYGSISSCRDVFTEGQGERMLYHIDNSLNLNGVETTVSDLLAPYKVVIRNSHYVYYPRNGEICNESEWKIEYQKGYNYKIKYLNGFTGYVEHDFTENQAPIVYVSSNFPNKNIQAINKTISENGTYTLYRSCQPVNNVQSTNLITSKTENHKVSKFNEYKYKETLDSGIYHLKFSTESGMNNSKKILNLKK